MDCFQYMQQQVLNLIYFQPIKKTTWQNLVMILYAEQNPVKMS